MKALDQQRRDHQRVTYRVVFPSELDAERVAAWVWSLSGTMSAGRFSLTGVPTVAFEVWGTHQGIVHILKVPWRYADYVVKELRGLVPGTHVTPETERPRRVWVRAAEVGLTHSSRTLLIDSVVHMNHRLLKLFESMPEESALMMQWVIAPAPGRLLPVKGRNATDRSSLGTVLHGQGMSDDEVRDRRKKLEEPNLRAVMRVAAVASTEEQASHLIWNIRHVLNVAARHPSRFRKRLFISRQHLQERLDQASGSVMFPINLSASELTALLAWPVGSPFVTGLAPSLTRQLPPVAAIGSEGRVIGTSNMAGAERRLAVSHLNALRHMHVLGPTGVGKTTLLANMMQQDMAAGHGIILIESKGDLFEAALDRVPKERIRDVIILDVNDTLMPVGFNILDQGNSRSAIDELGALVSGMYKDTQSVHAPQVLYHMLHALAEVPGSTFVDLPTMLSPQSPEEELWRDEVTRRVKNKEVRLFLQRFMNSTRTEQDRMSGPVHNRTWQFTARPEIRNIMGQGKSSFYMTDVIRENKILLVNLNGIRVGQQTASIAGTLLMNAVWQAVRSVRADNANYLYLDEFQDFINLPVAAGDMLAKSRSSGLGLVLAHQHLGQLPPELRMAVLGNTGTKVVFQTTADDARLMTREFGRMVSDGDFTSLGRHEALARIATNSGTSPPVTLLTSPPSPTTGNAKAVQQYSRNTYGRPIEDVLHEMETKKQDIKPTPKGKRPPITPTGTDWL